MNVPARTAKLPVMAIAEVPAPDFPGRAIRRALNNHLAVFFVEVTQGPTLLDILAAFWVIFVFIFVLGLLVLLIGMAQDFGGLRAVGPGWPW